MKICWARLQLVFTFDNRFSSTGCAVQQSVRYIIFCLQASYLSTTSHTGRKSCRVKSLRMKRFWVYSRVSSKQTKIIFGSNRNKLKQDLFRVCLVCFVKPVTKSFGLFRCFEPISKQPKPTELFRNKPKQTETTLNFLKSTQIYSLLNCLGGSSVCFGSIKTLCFGIEAKQPKHRNKLFGNKPKKTRKKPKKKNGKTEKKTKKP
jgi:hypothetical protein